MKLLRIGDKLLDSSKIERVVEEVLDLRSRGLSQQEVANKLSLDRTFISRLESIGEVRKGGKIAVIGFPIKNKTELEKILKEEEIEYFLIMTDRERRDFVGLKSGEELLNEMMEIISRVRTFETIIILGSNYRINLCRALLDKEVIGVELGVSPITEDVKIDLLKLRSLLRDIKQKS